MARILLEVREQHARTACLVRAAHMELAGAAELSAKSSVRIIGIADDLPTQERAALAARISGRALAAGRPSRQRCLVLQVRATVRATGERNRRSAGSLRGS